jgi:hypothetical protein
MKKVGAFFGLMFVCSLGWSQATYFDLRKQQTRSYAVPRYVKVASFRISKASAGRVTVKFKEPTPSTEKGRLVFEFYFRERASGKLQGLIMPIAHFAYPSREEIDTGKAGIVDLDSGKKIVNIAVHKHGDQYSFEVGRHFLGTHESWIGLMRYAPAWLDDSRVDFGQNCVAQVFFLSPKVKGRQLMYPVHPS